MRRSTTIKVIVVILLVAAVIAAIRLLPIAHWLRSFQAYVRELGPIGYIVYAIVYAVCVAVAIPASILTVGAGAIFGFVPGTIVVLFGATIGATLAFLLARTVLRKRVEAMTTGNPKFAALDRAIAEKGARIVLLVRLAVVFPFTYVNYAFGLTAIRLVPYVVATFIGIIPATTAFVFASSAATSAATAEASAIRRIIYIAGAVAAIVASAYVGRVATRAIKRAGVEPS